MPSFAKNRSFSPVWLFLLMIFAVAGCKTNKPATTDNKNSTDTTSSTTTTSTDLNALKEAQDASAKAKSELEESKAAIEALKKEMEEKGDQPADIAAFTKKFVEQLLQKNTFKEYGKFFLGVLKESIDETSPAQAAVKSITSNNKLEEISKDDFYEALEETSWTPSLRDTVLYLCLSPFTESGTDYIYESFWLYVSLSYEDRLKLIKKIATLYYAENPIENQIKNEQNLDGILDLFTVPVYESRQIKVQNEDDNEVDYVYTESDDKTWLSLDEFNRYDLESEKAFTEDAIYIKLFFEKTDPIFPTEGVKIVGYHFKDETAEDAKARADKIYEGLIKADVSLKNILKPVDEKDLKKMESNFQLLDTYVIAKFTIWEKTSEASSASK